MTKFSHIRLGHDERQRAYNIWKSLMHAKNNRELDAACQQLREACDLIQQAIMREVAFQILDPSIRGQNPFEMSDTD